MTAPRSLPSDRHVRLLAMRAERRFIDDADALLLDDGTPNPNVLPALALGLAPDKPGQRPAYNGLRVLNRLQERGDKPGYLAGDPWTPTGHLLPAA